MSLATAVIPPIAGALMKGVLARRNARLPIMLDCLTIVAQLRRGGDIKITDLFLEAEMLADLLRDLDDDAEVKSVLESFEQEYGGEQ